MSCPLLSGIPRALECVEKATPHGGQTAFSGQRRPKRCQSLTAHRLLNTLSATRRRLGVQHRPRLPYRRPCAVARPWCPCCPYTANALVSSVCRKRALPYSARAEKSGSPSPAWTSRKGSEREGVCALASQSPSPTRQARGGRSACCRLLATRTAVPHPRDKLMGAVPGPDRQGLRAPLAACATLPPGPPSACLAGEQD